MQFYRACACPAGGIYLIFDRVYEEADLDSMSRESLNHTLYLFLLPDHVEAALGGDLLPPLRHERRLVRFYAACDIHYLPCDRHLEVEPGADNFPKPQEIGILYVAPVFSQVADNGIAAGFFANPGRLDRIGLTCLPRLSYRSHMVYVDSEFRHGLLYLLLDRNVYGDKDLFDIHSRREGLKRDLLSDHRIASRD